MTHEKAHMCLLVCFFFSPAAVLHVWTARNGCLRIVAVASKWPRRKVVKHRRRPCWSNTSSKKNRKLHQSAVKWSGGGWEKCTRTPITYTITLRTYIQFPMFCFSHLCLLYGDCSVFFCLIAAWRSLKFNSHVWKPTGSKKEVLRMKEGRQHHCMYVCACATDSLPTALSFN